MSSSFPLASSSSSGSSSSSAPYTPTTRSRTNLFISYRDSSARRTPRRSRTYDDYGDTHNNGADGNESESLISHGAGAGRGHVALDVDLPPKWVDIADNVEDILAGTQAKITALERLHARHVLPGFTDRSAEEREIEAASSDITRDFRQCQTLIQRIPLSSSTAYPPTRTAAQIKQDAAAAKNVQRALAAKVQDLSAAFRKKQRVYMEKLQGHAIKNQDLLIASGTVSLKGSEGMSAVDEDIAAVASQSQQQQSLQYASLQSQQHAPDVNLTARTHELTLLASSIAELAGLFKDLSALVIDQGTLLDSVEWNVERAAVEVGEAVGELEGAGRYQKNTGRRSCIFLLVLIIVGLILVLVFKPRRHGGGGGAVVPVPGASSTASVGADVTASVGVVARVVWR
ncbi:hypothetical protein PLICRDRAFT_37664 [Plicaturopsis crispa FD-325 SS-3]|nr:hypothetical protein PLICRDRAFT_37664 [Plicaturopsis crispa FD-325 SS-3]